MINVGESDAAPDEGAGPSAHDEMRLTTAEAAERLGVKPETLYAYVSRGLIERRRSAQGSTFAAADVERLARAGRRTRKLPALVFPSALTLIDDHHLAYRGLDVVELSRTRTFEDVAEWLWRGEWPPDNQRWRAPTGALRATLDAQAPLPDRCSPLDRLRVIVSVAAAIDELRHDIAPDVATATARRLIRLLIEAMPPATGRRGLRRDDAGRSLAELLWTRLSRLPVTEARARVLNAALVLLADHELATSTLAVRAAAMVRADIYEVVGTGLNVVGGTKHGGVSVVLGAILIEADEAGVGRTLEQRLAQSGVVEGFGHPLYPDGDPRFSPLAGQLDALEPDTERRALIDRFLAAAEQRRLPPPNIDAALAALAWCGEMRAGAGETIFAIARTAGWIAHALEQYDQPTFMRARVDYTGPSPSRPRG